MSTAISTDTDRTAAARRNWDRNCHAMRSVGLEIPAGGPIDGCWTTARDGSTTTRTGDGRWWAGCSVPLLAGRSLLQSLESGNTMTACLLHPEHAGVVRACREIIGRDTVLMIIHPDAAAVRHILHAHDFADDIAAHRMIFFAGDNWLNQLRSHLYRLTGLATPSRFVRTKLTADLVIEQLIAAAQAAFSEISAGRTRQLGELRSTETPITAGRTLVIGPTRFQLWRPSVDDLWADLSGVGLTAVRFDTDDALNGSPLALANAAAGCDAVFAADVFRSDAPDLVSDRTAWITWVTRSVVPQFDTAGPRDRILLADPAWRKLTRNAGWPADRIGVRPHPAAAAIASASRPLLGVLADFVPPEIPDSVKTFSSHKILWEAIETELTENPLAIDGDIAAYLTDRAERMNLTPSELDQTAYFNRLIVPCFQRGLVRLLVRAGLPVALFGAGWTDDPALVEFAAGDLRSKNDLNDAVARCTALVHVLPIPGIHPIDALGRPVVRPNKNEPFLRAIKRALNVSTVAVGD